MSEVQDAVPVPEVSQTVESLKPYYQGVPAYPVTVIPLPHRFVLRHLPTESVDQLEEGVLSAGGEGPLSLSRFRVEGSDGMKVVEFPSMLSLPSAKDGEFEQYYRKNDEISIYVSGTGNTIILVEDRSPNFPNEVFHLIKLRAGSAHWERLGIAAAREPVKEGSMPTSGYGQYPRLVALTDEVVTWESFGRVWKEKLP